MRAIIVAAAAAIAITAPVVAQPANPNAETPAIATPDKANPGAPAEGSNSFTEAQAKSRIEGQGFSNVTGLVLDDSGVWRGKAMRNGKPADVSLDFQGNVVAR